MNELKDDIDNGCTEPLIASATTNMDVIWNTNDTLPLSNFTSENLPDIGSCQVSSILSTLESPGKEGTSPAPDQFKSIAFNVCSDDIGGRKTRGHLVMLEQRQLYEEMVFFGCNLCPFICTKDSKISDHIDSVHRRAGGESPRVKLKCPGCTNVFHHKLSLRSHLIYDHEVGKSDINKIVNGIVYVSNMMNNQNDKVKTDTIIEENNKTEMDFLQDGHISSEEEIETERNVEQKQENITEDVNSNKCPIGNCNVRMRDPNNLQYHTRCHSNDTFICLECNESFSAWRSLQTHLWRHHRKDTELHKCDQCQYRTHSLAQLNNIHRPTHSAERPCLCDHCGKGFKNTKQLRNHRQTHRTDPSNVKRHACSTCHRTFSDARQLRVHIQSVHDKLKPYACSCCGYRASTSGALRMHVRQHTGERPHACDQCAYRTADHNSLRRHKLRHSGVMKYRCSYCSYACIQSSTYKQHIRTKHPGQEGTALHACDICQFRTLSTDKYLVHVATHQQPIVNSL